MSTNYVQAQYESVPGNEYNTPTLSTKVIYLPATTFTPQVNPSPMIRDDEMRGIDEPIAVLPEAFQPQWDSTTRAYPDVTGFELKACLGAPTTTAGDGVITDPDTQAIPTGATRHVWTAPYGPAGASPLTTQRQASYATESTFFKLKGCATDTLSLDSPQSGGVTLKSSGPALYLVRQADPALTASYEALTIAPFERAHLVIETWLGSTAVTEDFNVAIANPMDGTIRTLGGASKFPDLVEKGDTPIVVSGSIPKRHINATDWDALINATAFTVKVRWQSTVVIGATTYKYALWLECNNCQYVGGAAEAMTNKRRLGATFDWKATYSGTAGSSKWTLVNATASYA